VNTDDLIETMAQGLEPVPPLWRPSTRAVVWFVGAALYLGALVVAMGLAGTNTASAGAPFWISQMAAIVAGILASGAAFASVVPGSAKGSRAWALFAALVWLGTLLMAVRGEGTWGAVPGASHEWICVGFIVIGGAPLMLALTLMLRRGAPLNPAVTAVLAALAVGTLANVGACVSLPHANSAVTFTWHGGVVLALVLLAALSGRRVFTWGESRLPSNAGAMGDGG